MFPATQEKQWGSSKSGHEQWEAVEERNFSWWRKERNSDPCKAAIIAKCQFLFAKMNLP